MFENIEIQRRPSITQILPSSSNIASAIRGANVLRRGETPALPTARAPMGSREVAARPSMFASAARDPTARANGGSMGTRTIAERPSMFGGATRAPTNIPSPSRIPADIGGAARTLPTGRSVVSPVAGDRTGIVPPSTLSTQGAFGGESGGMGAGAGAGAGGGAGAGAGADLGLGGIGDSISSLGSGIVDTIKEYIPLAIKVILAIIVIKIVLWLLRGRR
jgi:hypothetical protein